MHENRRILELARKAESAGEKFALATVVRVKGSSYRRPGAKMLILQSGEIAGSVSGGCLERDLIRRAGEAMTREESKLLCYDTRSDSDDSDAEAYVTSVGLGCEGVIEIFLNPAPRAHLEALASSLDTRSDVDFGIALPDGSHFTDKILRLPQLVIFGAGHDAVPLAKMAALLGLEVSVIDCRSSFPTPHSMFSTVDSLIRGEPETIVEKLSIGDHSLIVTMTHNYEHDHLILAQVFKRCAPGAPAYVGMLGPKSRSERILQSIEAEGISFNSSRLHYPVGLDIGGDTPESIALSIVAEIQCVLSKRKGGFLRERVGSIHPN